MQAAHPSIRRNSIHFQIKLFLIVQQFPTSSSNWAAQKSKLKQCLKFSADFLFNLKINCGFVNYIEQLNLVFGMSNRFSEGTLFFWNARVRFKTHTQNRKFSKNLVRFLWAGQFFRIYSFEKEASVRTLIEREPRSWRIRTRYPAQINSNHKKANLLKKREFYWD